MKHLALVFIFSLSTAVIGEVNVVVSDVRSEIFEELGTDLPVGTSNYAGKEYTFKSLPRVYMRMWRSHPASRSERITTSSEASQLHKIRIGYFETKKEKQYLRDPRKSGPDYSHVIYTVAFESGARRGEKFAFGFNRPEPSFRYNKENGSFLVGLDKLGDKPKPWIESWFQGGKIELNRKIALFDTDLADRGYTAWRVWVEFSLEPFENETASGDSNTNLVSE